MENKRMKNPNKTFTVLLIVLVLLSIIVFLIGNEQLFLFINQGIANPVLDFIVLNILIPLFFLLGIIPFIMLFFDKYRVLGAFSLFSGPFCYVVGSLIKLFFKMPRPFNVLSISVIGPWHVGQFSFPSTTTMLAFGFALPFLIQRKPKWSLFFLTLSILVGFSVIYTGFHFPSDVLGGIFFSILIVLLLNKIKTIIINKMIEHGA
ncbi:MAG: phosphatase PAP2 family protein [Candidatus Nealsonbacteria bacterium]